MVISEARSSFSKQKTANMQTQGVLTMLVVLALFGAQLPKVQCCLSCANQEYWKSVNHFLWAALREVTAAEAITLADADQDGKLTTQEAYDYLSPYYYARNPERFTIDNLEQFNANGDGYLSAAEIEHARKKLAAQLKHQFKK